MTAGERIRATYEFRPVDHLYRTEFYIWPEAIERWKTEGLPDDWEEKNVFNYDNTAIFPTNIYLGWCEPPFIPAFEEKIIESRRDHDIIQDSAGRLLKVFRGRRHGFMPEYIKHPVSCMEDLEKIAPRLNPNNAERWEGLKDKVQSQRKAADAVNGLVHQQLIGGYMYLRALIGPEDLLYMFYDQPDVIHAAMRFGMN